MHEECSLNQSRKHWLDQSPRPDRYALSLRPAPHAASPSTFLESLKPSGWQPRNTTAAATTGPASGPRPTSSTPARSSGLATPQTTSRLVTYLRCNPCPHRPGTRVRAQPLEHRFRRPLIRTPTKLGVQCFESGQIFGVTRSLVQLIEQIFRKRRGCASCCSSSGTSSAPARMFGSATIAGAEQAPNDLVGQLSEPVAHHHRTMQQHGLQGTGARFHQRRIAGVRAAWHPRDRARPTGPGWRSERDRSPQRIGPEAGNHKGTSGRRARSLAGVQKPGPSSLTSDSRLPGRHGNHQSSAAVPGRSHALAPCFRRHLEGDFVRQRVPDEYRLNAGLRIESRLERIEGEQQIRRSRMRRTRPRARHRPTGYVVRRGNTAVFEQPLQQKVEHVEVDADEGIRIEIPVGSEQCPETPTRSGRRLTGSMNPLTDSRSISTTLSRPSASISGPPIPTNRTGSRCCFLTAAMRPAPSRSPDGSPARMPRIISVSFVRVGLTPRSDDAPSGVSDGIEKQRDFRIFAGHVGESPRRLPPPLCHHDRRSCARPEVP